MPNAGKVRPTRLKKTLQVLASTEEERIYEVGSKFDIPCSRDRNDIFFMFLDIKKLSG